MDAGVVVGLIAGVIAVGGIVLTYFIERERKPKIIAKLPTPSLSALDRDRDSLVWCVEIVNVPTSGFFNFVARQTARAVKARVVVEDRDHNRPFAADDKDIGAELSFIEPPPTHKEIWKLNDLPEKRSVVVDLVPGRSYLVPLVYGLSDQLSLTLIDQPCSREGKRVLREGDYYLLLSLTGEGLNKALSFHVNRKAKNFNTITMEMYKNGSS